MAISIGDNFQPRGTSKSGVTNRGINLFKSIDARRRDAQLVASFFHAGLIATSAK